MEITEAHRERLRTIIREREAKLGITLSEWQREAVIDGFFERMSEEGSK
jgi:hypothetical protein